VQPGDLLWEIPLNEPTSADPLIGFDGTIYAASGRYVFGTQAGTLYAISPAGAVKLTKRI